MPSSSNVMVNHRLRVILKPFDEKLIVAQSQELTTSTLRSTASFIQNWLVRIADLTDQLTADGWICSGDWKNIVLESDTVEADDAKKIMLANGFALSDFEIRLDYTRKWGVL